MFSAASAAAGKQSSCIFLTSHGWRPVKTSPQRAPEAPVRMKMAAREEAIRLAIERKSGLLYVFIYGGGEVKARAN